MALRGRPRTLPADRVRIDLELPRGDAEALLKIFPEGYTAALRQLVRDFLKQSIEWVDRQLKEEEDRHIESRAFYHDLKELAKKNRLQFNEEELRKIRARSIQVKLNGFDETLHRSWCRSQGFTIQQEAASAQLMQEWLTP